MVLRDRPHHPRRGARGERGVTQLAQGRKLVRANLHRAAQEEPPNGRHVDAGGSELLRRVSPWFSRLRWGLVGLRRRPI